MVATSKSLFERTAADLQSHVVVTLRASMPLREAAKQLNWAGIHDAPVVDDAGRCVGVLSVTDVARWAVRRTGPTVARPKTCGYQHTHRGIAGEETVMCTLPEGKCPFQTEKHLHDGRTVMECREPHSVLFEWQTVEMEMLPIEDVRHYMAAEPTLADSHASIIKLARMMVNSIVQRVIIVDDERRPTGIVTATDLVAAIAAAGEDDNE